MALRYVDIRQFVDGAGNVTGDQARLQAVRDWLAAEGVTGMQIFRMTTIVDDSSPDVGKVTVEFVQNNQLRSVNRRPTNRPPWESWEKARPDNLPKVFF